MKVKTIAYGKDYNATVTKFLGGEPIDFHTRVISTCIYVKPFYTVYALPSGRVVKKVKQTMADVVYLYDSENEYSTESEKYWKQFPDPETGRYAY